MLAAATTGVCAAAGMAATTTTTGVSAAAREMRSRSMWRREVRGRMTRRGLVEMRG